jgi:hypothetical protein
MRSHPSELIARHLGELASPPDARKSWFELSLELSENAPAGGTIHRFGAFTRRLLSNEGPLGPVGCVTNPTFEYR